jgi:aminoglycoside phosphotransferase (APT) family kinase protein
MSASNPTLGPLLASGKEAEAFELGDRVVKLFRPLAAKDSAFREAANLALAERAGLPTPHVYGVQLFDERWGIVISRVAGSSFAEAIRAAPESMPSHLKAMALLHLRVHRHPAFHFASLKARLAANIRRATILGEVAHSRLLADLLARPDGDRLCHGDFHMFNILGRTDQPMLLDWLDACSGDPAADVCRSYLLMSRSTPAIASAYVEHYAEVSGTSAREILSWLPLVAAARLAEGVQSETAVLLEMALSTGWNGSARTHGDEVANYSPLALDSKAACGPGG